MSEAQLQTGRDRVCDRCERDIHDLEPATGIQFGGSVQTDEMLICHDCIEFIIEWWDEGQQ